MMPQGTKPQLSSSPLRSVPGLALVTRTSKTEGPCHRRLKEIYSGGGWGGAGAESLRSRTRCHRCIAGHAGTQRGAPLGQPKAAEGELWVFVLFCFCFLGLYPKHMEVPRLGVQSSHSCQPIPQPQQHQILDPLSETRDQTCILMDTSWICYR